MTINLFISYRQVFLFGLERMNRMRWIDGHCDVLWKMWEAREPISFYDADSPLDVRFPKARAVGIGLQVFALFVSPKMPKESIWDAVLRQVDLFHEEIVRDGSEVAAIGSAAQLENLKDSGKMGALLSLEGADALAGELYRLRVLHRLGVRQLGLTWNHANEAADGVEEDRGGGLTRFGRTLVEEVTRLRMILDVSHLSERGFWDVMEFSDVPVIASHSNCHAVCPHRRNLKDGQIRALVEKEGIMGIAFVPQFVHEPKEEAAVEHLFRHIDHVCELGGERILAFGSDFDGISHKIGGLEDVGSLPYLEEQLLKRYPEHWVRRWMWGNWYDFYRKHLP
ncbi:membrane dipeptidase [Planifilum fulgidum]|uniref:Membrane dipeptidase n=2 Tax=Planifilum fulgidum TaxID=201973 RepID=A0A1I2SK81_9BACL|nr:membrane dipeptidase [Planifilum fulgidum]